jgi:DNA-directed RNA polymerase subunit RPC12/RpoP
MMRTQNATSRVDGNAAAGLLTEVFAVDVTTMRGACGACGSAGPLAEAVVELDDVAAIIRCRTCTHTLMTVLRTDDGVRLVIGSLRELVRA